MSREEVARGCGLSLDTVHSYELGRRGPHRETLAAMVSALNLNRRDSNAILRSAGFIADQTVALADLQNLVESCERVPWPQMIQTDDLHILYVNKLMTKLSGRDLLRTLPTVERHGFVVLAHGLPLGHLANWEENVAFSIAQWKRAVGYEMPSDRPWMPSLTERLARLGKLSRFLELWERTPALPPGGRGEILFVGTYPGVGTLRFCALNSGVPGCPDVSVYDLIPADGDTWHALETVS